MRVTLFLQNALTIPRILENLNYICGTGAPTMLKSKTRAKQTGLLTRLRKDQAGNVAAITAAALVPLAGLFGGSIDIGRIYSVRTRLQAACDAGALTGRKVMSSSAWNTAADTAAKQMFTANFENGYFSVTNVIKNFTGADGRVTGTVSAVVPMTMMRFFGFTQETVSVECTSEMRIPNTDVMFVMDTTGSMNCSPSDTPATCGSNGGVEKSDARIKGLRTAVNCFYESLAKVDTGELCNASGDPAATGLAAGIQLRVGFVPYSSNVNVGKLLPTAFMDDNWTYQSRAPNFATTYTWSNNGSSSTGVYSAWSSTTSRPVSSSYNTTASYGSATDQSGGATAVQIGGTDFFVSGTVSGATSANCNSYNTLGSGSTAMRAVGDNPGTTSTSNGAYDTPVYPQASRSRTKTQSRTNTVTGYRYVWSNNGSGNACRLQSMPGNTSSPNTRWAQSHTATETQPIAWSSSQELTSWTEKPVSINISGLKNGTNWNGSFVIPNADYTSSTVNRSGQSSSSTLYRAANKTVNWEGCIEERQTFQNTDGNPDDDWSPSIPSTAFDMDIDMLPSGTAGTKWAPALEGLIFGRADASNNRTLSDVVTNANDGSDKLNGLDCPAQANRVQVWNSGADISTYTDGLVANGSTYHDLGLLWGARLLSPTGIFGAANSSDASGNPITIQRHMIFMTDGDTNTNCSSYTPHGTAWWDRRQAIYAYPDNNCTTITDRITNARMVALCNAIKNKNITLWVVSYGSGVDTTTKSRLVNCASSTSHYFDSTSTADLQAAFKEIALEISRLRLQN
jgi:Flp pilus assembly protein TadG